VGRGFAFENPRLDELYRNYRLTEAAFKAPFKVWLVIGAALHHSIDTWLDAE
jgi:hypothetical protein